MHIAYPYSCQHRLRTTENESFSTEKKPSHLLSNTQKCAPTKNAREFGSISVRDRNQTATDDRKQLTLLGHRVWSSPRASHAVQYAGWERKSRAQCLALNNAVSQSIEIHQSIKLSITSNWKASHLFFALCWAVVRSCARPAFLCLSVAFTLRRRGRRHRRCRAG